MRPWLLLIAALAPACATLPDSQPLPGGEESAHSVTEVSPGWWHVMVRVNYFAPPTEAERLLRERAAGLCPDTEAVVEDLRLVSQPHQASAEIHCRAAQSALDELVTDLAHRTADHATVHTAVFPEARQAPERSMVRSGAGVAGERPEPGFLPSFAQVATGDQEVEVATSAAATPAPAEDPEPVGGWIPATGKADRPAAVVVAEEDLAETPQEAADAKPFWPAVGNTFRNLVAELE
jgi:hypothetical protein